MNRKLRRNTREGALSGVCAGIAEYFQIDKTWVRLAFVISVIFSSMLGLGLLGPAVYIILWAVLPVKPLMEPDFFAGGGMPRGGNAPYDVDYRVREEQTASPYDNQFGQTTFTPQPPYDVQYKSYAPNKGRNRDRYLAGLILLMVGAFFLLHQLGVLFWRDLVIYWPVLLILSGVVILFNAFSESKPVWVAEPIHPESTDRESEDSTSMYKEGE